MCFTRFRGIIRIIVLRSVLWSIVLITMCTSTSVLFCCIIRFPSTERLLNSSYIRLSWFNNFFRKYTCFFLWCFSIGCCLCELFRRCVLHIHPHGGDCFLWVTVIDVVICLCATVGCIISNCSLISNLFVNCLLYISNGDFVTGGMLFEYCFRSVAINCSVLLFLSIRL